MHFVLNIGREESLATLPGLQIPEGCQSVPTGSNHPVIRELREIQKSLFVEGQFLVQDLPFQNQDPTVINARFKCSGQHEVAAFEGLNVVDYDIPVVIAGPVVRLPARLQVEHLQQSSAYNPPNSGSP